MDHFVPLAESSLVISISLLQFYSVSPASERRSPRDHYIPSSGSLPSLWHPGTDPASPHHSGKFPGCALPVEKPQIVLGNIPRQPLFWNPGFAGCSDLLKEPQRLYSASRVNLVWKTKLDGPSRKSLEKSDTGNIFAATVSGYAWHHWRLHSRRMLVSSPLHVWFQRQRRPWQRTPLEVSYTIFPCTWWDLFLLLNQGLLNSNVTFFYKSGKEKAYPPEAKGKQFRMVLSIPLRTGRKRLSCHGPL